MSVHENTLDDLVGRITKLRLNDGLEGTATGGSTTTMVDTSRTEVADYFNELEWAELHMRTGAAAGQTRQASDFATNTTTVPVAWDNGAAVASGDLYRFHFEYKYNEIVEAINSAIDAVAKEALIDIIDETTISLVASTYEYVLPTGLVYLYAVTMADADGDFYDEKVPADEYRILRSDPPKIKFLLMPNKTGRPLDHWYGELFASADLTAARLVRVEGLGRQVKLVHDTDICYINPNYVCYQAAADLHLSRTRSAESDPDAHRVQAELCQRRADIERERATKIQLPPDSKKVTN